jgi:hypothetical protein
MKPTLQLLISTLFVLTFQVATAQTLIAYYPVNGNAGDASGNGNHGIANGPDLTTDMFGNALSAYSFNGINDYISIATYSNFNNMNEFTIAAWIYPVFIGSNNTIISKVSPSRDFVFKITGNGNLQAHFNDGTYHFCTGTSSLAINTWHHVAMVRDGATWKVYVNGVLENSVDFPSNSPFWVSNQMGIGAMNSLENFNGKIDELRIWTGAMTDGEILNLVTDVEEEQMANTSLSVYPNPTTDALNIDMTGFSRKGAQIEIVNTIGEVVYSEYWKGSESIFTLHKAAFASGLYIVKVTGHKSTRLAEVIFE